MNVQTTPDLERDLTKLFTHGPQRMTAEYAQWLEEVTAIKLVNELRHEQRKFWHAQGTGYSLGVEIARENVAFMRRIVLRRFPDEARSQNRFAAIRREASPYPSLALECAA